MEKSMLDILAWVRYFSRDYRILYNCGEFLEGDLSSFLDR